MRLLIFSTLLILSFGTIAERASGKISGLIAYESAGKILLLKLHTLTAKGCNITNRLAFNDSNINFELMSSTVLSAYHSKTRV